MPPLLVFLVVVFSRVRILDGHAPPRRPRAVTSFWLPISLVVAVAVAALGLPDGHYAYAALPHPTLALIPVGHAMWPGTVPWWPIGMMVPAALVDLIGAFDQRAIPMLDKDAQSTTLRSLPTHHDR